MNNDYCRVEIPEEGRDRLADQIEQWATSTGRRGIVDLGWGDAVTVYADPELCDVLRAYFQLPALWDGGFKDFVSALGSFDALFEAHPAPED